MDQGEFSVKLEKCWKPRKSNWHDIRFYISLEWRSITRVKTRNEIYGNKPPCFNWSNCPQKSPTENSILFDRIDMKTPAKFFHIITHFDTDQCRRISRLTDKVEYGLRGHNMIYIKCVKLRNSIQWFPSWRSQTCGHTELQTYMQINTYRHSVRMICIFFYCVEKICSLIKWILR